MAGSKLRTEPRIAIVGAGPAGLSAAHFLKEQRFASVDVFEKLGRVGGLCRSVTEGYKSFDLGANYVTPAYRETLKLARKVGARRIKAHLYQGARVEGGELREYEISELIRQDPEDPQQPGDRVPLWDMARAIVRFDRIRRELAPIIDQPTFERIDEHPELCVPFDRWLDANGLRAMRGLFLVPVTAFGYGFLDEIPAAYVLKYMHPKTYRAMIKRGLPVVGGLARWPKRFQHGFGRMWERLAWDLNVKTDFQITEIERHCDGPRPIRIAFEYEQEQEEQHDWRVTKRGQLFFDRLILACPLTAKNLETFLDLSDEERELFSKVEPSRFCHLTLYGETETGRNFKLPKPVVIVFPFSRATIGKPWAVVQYWEDASPLIQIYARGPMDEDMKTVEAETKANAKWLLRSMGARVADEPRKALREEFVCWPYFGRVNSEEMEKGFFRRLEGLQGRQNTFYAGGATNFELVEPIVQYSKHLVRKHFAPAP